MAETFYFEIIASDKKFYSGACEHVIFPAVDGLYGVLANHEDTVTAVVAGELRFKVDGEWKVCVVGEGFADVTRDFVVIVVDTVERPEDIDIIRAREAKTRAEERLKQKQSRYGRKKKRLQKLLDKSRSGLNNKTMQQQKIY